ncbi:MAG: hypothetical protein HY701_04455 [Gemmatimonadetes bacterium]|nr:hypothetical protein [Gemmatimonadota bacterium]
MSDRRIDLVAGARPNFVKPAPLAGVLARPGVTPRLVPTGQHCSSARFHGFCAELRIPRPDVLLHVDPGTDSGQIAEAMRW